jgi:hypothetical protein
MEYASRPETLRIEASRRQSFDLRFCVWGTIIGRQSCPHPINAIKDISRVTHSDVTFIEPIEGGKDPKRAAPGVPESPEPLDPVIPPPIPPGVPPIPGPDIPPVPENEPEPPVPVEEPPLDPNTPDEPSKPLIAFS